WPSSITRWFHAQSVLDALEQGLHVLDADDAVGHDLTILDLPHELRPGHVAVGVELDGAGRAEVLDRLARLDELDRLLELRGAGGDGAARRARHPGHRRLGRATR